MIPGFTSRKRSSQDESVFQTALFLRGIPFNTCSECDCKQNFQFSMFLRQMQYTHTHILFTKKLHFETKTFLNEWVSRKMSLTDVFFVGWSTMKDRTALLFVLLRDLTTLSGQKQSPVSRAFIKNSSSMPSLNISYLSCTTVFLFLSKFFVWRWSPKMTCTQLFSTAFGKDMPFFSDCHDSIGVAKKPIRWRVPQDRLSQLVLRILFWSRVRWWLRLFSAMMALDTKWGDV